MQPFGLVIEDFLMKLPDENLKRGIESNRVGRTVPEGEPQRRVYTVSQIDFSEGDQSIRAKFSIFHRYF
jgi:hypothetical protein